MNSPGVATPLQYEQQPSWYRRKTMRRVVAVVALLIGLVALLPLLFDHLKLMSAVSLQNRCLEYAPAANQPALVLTFGKNQNVVQQPRVDSNWAQLYTSLAPVGLKSSGTTVLHEMRTPEGLRRLIAVDVANYGVKTQNMATSQPLLATATLDFAVKMVEPGTLMRPPREMPITVFDRISNQPRLFGKTLTVEQGTRDPADATHFTFVIKTDDVLHTVDGWVTGDNTVVLEMSPTNE